MKSLRFVLAAMLLGATSICFAADSPMKVGTSFDVPLANGKTAQALVLAGPTAGEYYMLVIVDGKANVGKYIPSAALPGPVPPPPPPPPPPTIDVKEKSATEASKIGNPAECKQMAELYSAIAKKIGTVLPNGTTLDTIPKVIQFTKFSRDQLLKPERQASWNTWAESVGKLLDDFQKAGKIKSPNDVKTAWLSIADGLTKAGG